MSRVTIDVVGVRVQVITRDPVQLSAVDDLLIDAVADCTIETGETDVESILADVALAAVDVAPSLLIHAGAVARNGRAALLPGASGAGKSTTTAACVRQGLDYVTDELVAVELDSGVVSGFSRPLMLTPWSAGALGVGSPSNDDAKQPVPAAQLGGTIAATPLVATHVVDIRLGATQASLTRMTPGETLALLLQSSFNHFRHGQVAWHAASKLAARAAGWRLDVADPMSAATKVDDLLRNES